MKIEIRQEPFEPYREIEQYQQSIKPTGKIGATSSFVGTMRDFNQQQNVRGMTLEYYPGMTEKHIIQICNDASEKWTLLDCLVLHRVGEIDVKDVIVLITVWASHRGDAMDACRHILEDLKSKAPFWKKERLEEGEKWVEGNTSGYVKSEE
ncbi:MAG: molybdopterin synthase catalytic subunit [Gammaproteobacteria bacterium]|jgi:molybdopterin synthase catalytic subunit